MTIFTPIEGINPFSMDHEFLSLDKGFYEHYTIHSIYLPLLQMWEKHFLRFIAISLYGHIDLNSEHRPVTMIIHLGRRLYWQ